MSLWRSRAIYLFKYEWMLYFFGLKSPWICSYRSIIYWMVSTIKIKTNDIEENIANKEQAIFTNYTKIQCFFFLLSFIPLSNHIFVRQILTDLKYNFNACALRMQGDHNYLHRFQPSRTNWISTSTCFAIRMHRWFLYSHSSCCTYIARAMRKTLRF